MQQQPTYMQQQLKSKEGLLQPPHQGACNNGSEPVDMIVLGRARRAAQTTTATVTASTCSGRRLALRNHTEAAAVGVDSRSLSLSSLLQIEQKHRSQFDQI
jgi:hypothetical protein